MSIRTVGTNQTARLLVELREERGLTPEQMPFAMLKAGVARECIPSPRSIYRAEQGTRPQLRHRVGLSRFYGVPMQNLWPATARVAA